MAHSNTHEHDSGESHGSVKSYLWGFVLSVILTALSFAVVLNHVLPKGMEVPVLALLALVQVVVHLTYFLHMNASSAQRWNVTAFAFTVLIAAIVIGGSVWIMYNANLNMV